jgi:hypothetical protein
MASLYPGISTIVEVYNIAILFPLSRLFLEHTLSNHISITMEVYGTFVLWNIIFIWDRKSKELNCQDTSLCLLICILIQRLTIVQRQCNLVGNEMAIL